MYTVMSSLREFLISRFFVPSVSLNQFVTQIVSFLSNSINTARPLQSYLVLLLTFKTTAYLQFLD